MNEEALDSYRQLEKAAEKEKVLFDELTRARKALYGQWEDVWEHKQRMMDYRRMHRKWLKAHGLWSDLRVKYNLDLDSVEE